MGSGRDTRRLRIDVVVRTEEYPEARGGDTPNIGTNIGATPERDTNPHGDTAPRDGIKPASYRWAIRHGAADR